MLINNQRELAYIVKIDTISPIEGADRVELATVGGWQVMVKKDQFKPGDYAIYFEIDSKVPNEPPFEFLDKCNFKIKTQKYFKQTVLSQGLLMSIYDFITKGTGGVEHIPEWFVALESDIKRGADVTHYPLTKALKVTHIDDQEKRPLNPAEKKNRVGKIVARHPWLKNTSFGKWLLKKPFGQSLVLALYKNEKFRDGRYPDWIKKTDEERIENLPHLLGKEIPLIATEKIDGCSATYALKRLKKNKFEYFVGSRNVIFDNPTQGSYYDENVWFKISQEYQIETLLKKILDDYPQSEYVILQGEIYGKGIQKRDYSMQNINFAAFNLILSDYGRFNYYEMRDVLEIVNSDIPVVPFDSEFTKLPDTIEELRAIVNSEPSQIDGGMREGLVLRSLDGKISFKCVSPEYLMKY